MVHLAMSTTDFGADYSSIMTRQIVIKVDKFLQSKDHKIME